MALKAPFTAIVGERNALFEPAELRTYECDGLTGFARARRAGRPARSRRRGGGVGARGAIARPRRSCRAARGRASRAARCRPRAAIVVGTLAHERDPRRRRSEPAHARAARRHQPRRQPSASRRSATTMRPTRRSQSVCSIGGNVAENSGGAHCLKYGFTVNHVVGGHARHRRRRDRRDRRPGRRRPATICSAPSSAAKGMLGIVTEAVVRFLRRPQGRARSSRRSRQHGRGGRAVSAIVARGIVPAAVEMMDQLAIEAIVAATGRRLAARRRCGVAGRRRRHGGRSRADGATLATGDRAPCGALEVRSAARRRASARSCGRAARARSPRWAASARTTTCRTASSRARRSAAVLREISELGRERRAARRERLSRRRRQSAPARAVRRAHRRAKRSSRSASAARSCACASATAARSRANTASAPTSPSTWANSSPTTTSKR